MSHKRETFCGTIRHQCCTNYLPFFTLSVSMCDRKQSLCYSGSAGAAQTVANVVPSNVAVKLFFFCFLMRGWWNARFNALRAKDEKWPSMWFVIASKRKRHKWNFCSNTNAIFTFSFLRWGGAGTSTDPPYLSPYIRKTGSTQRFLRHKRSIIELYYWFSVIVRGRGQWNGGPTDRKLTAKTAAECLFWSFKVTCSGK